MTAWTTAPVRTRGPRITLSGVLLAVAMGATLAGCSALPSQGPMAGDVQRQARTESGQARYLIADLDPRVASIVESSPVASFTGRFAQRAGGAPLQVIGVGDAVTVTIWEAAAGGLFTSPIVGAVSTGSHSAIIPEQQVARDGSITVPYAGRVRVQGLTAPQVERAVVAQLQGKAIEPQAIVTVSKNLSNTVTVTGEAGQGGRIPLSPAGDRVLDVVASAGGPRGPVHETFISLMRGGTIATVPMQALVLRPSENVYLRPGDTLTLIRNPQSFTAFGATGRNAMVPFDAVGITLQEALAKAGGLLDFQADPAGVFLLRPEPVSVARRIDPSYPIPPGAAAVNVVYRLNLRDANTYFLARDFPVRNKDIVYVASAQANQFQKFLGLVNGTIGTATQPVLAGASIYCTSTPTC